MVVVLIVGPGNTAGAEAVANDVKGVFARQVRSIIQRNTSSDIVARNGGVTGGNGSGDLIARHMANDIGSRKLDIAGSQFIAQDIDPEGCQQDCWHWR